MQTGIYFVFFHGFLVLNSTYFDYGIFRGEFAIVLIYLGIFEKSNELFRRMGDSLRNGPYDRDIEQAITALKKGAQLLKYGRRGKPKFCPFRLSIDESSLIWYVGKLEKQLILNQVTKVIPGQRTAIFQRYPQPDKEYQSFSLIYKDRSLDVICKDKDEAEVWFVGLKALISGGKYHKRSESEGDGISDSNGLDIQTSFRADTSKRDSVDLTGVSIPCENPPTNGLGKVFSDVLLYTAPRTSICTSLISFSSGCVDNSNSRCSGTENIRVSASSAISSSSHGSGLDDFGSLSDVYIWGEVTTDRFPSDNNLLKADALLPKALQAAILLDVQHIACGSKYVMLVTKQGEVYSWGEESGGRLGHGVDVDITHPKLIDSLSDINIQFVACGEYHSCAVTLSGDLYTWGDDVYNCGLLGHGSESSHWVPKLVVSPLDGIQVSSVSCGPWHTAIVTYSGQLFTFGDGNFGALGHGDRLNRSIPKEVDALRGFHTVKAACGIWHTAAIVEIMSDDSRNGKLFTWGDGDKGRLGHGDNGSRLIPACVNSLTEPSFCQVACGQDLTVALTFCGRVYTMGSFIYEADGMLPTCAEGKLIDSFVEALACGYHHIAVLTSKAEVYTWGKGTNGQLGQGDKHNRTAPTLVETLKGKQVKKIVCGPNFTAATCTHKLVSSDDMTMCSGCHLPFGFRRKRHNCYNCGLVFCNSCSTKKSVKAALAPNIHKPYRVCDECYSKLKKCVGSGIQHSQIPKHPNGSQNQMSSELVDKDNARPQLLSISSFKGESVRKQSCKSESDNYRSSPILNEKSPWGSIRNILSQSSNKIFSASVPGSRIASRSTSPVHSMPSPPCSTATPFLTCIASPDYSKKRNYSMSEEVVSLQIQVEDLTHKNQLLEAKLEQTSKQYREATAIVKEETARYKAAKEVNKLLTSQMKEMAERVGEGYVFDANGTLTEELVDLDEPGIFITVSLNPGGEVFLKRVHLSRKQFNEQQAKMWWTENRQKLQQKFHSCSVKDVKNEMVD